MLPYLGGYAIADDQFIEEEDDNQSVFNNTKKKRVG